MANITRFEEMEIWKMAEKQCAAFFELVKGDRFVDHFSLKDQMDRSSGSVMDNIAKGFDRFSKIDFRHFLVIARGSNAEFRSQLYRCQSRSIISEEEFQKLRKANEYIGIKIHHFIAYLTRSDYKTKPVSSMLTEQRSIEEPDQGYNLQDLNNLPEWLD